MGKSRTVTRAKVKIGWCEFRIEQKLSEDGGTIGFYLYRCYTEYHGALTAHCKRLDGKFEFYHDVLKTLAEYQERYYYYGHLPTLEEISV